MGAIQRREFDRVTNEEDGKFIPHDIPVPFIREEL